MFQRFNSRFKFWILELYLQPVTYDGILDFSLHSCKGQDCRDGFFYWPTSQTHPSKTTMFRLNV